MDEETLYCHSCDTRFTVLFHQEDEEMMLTPSYCPLCGSPITGEDQNYFNQEDYE